MLNTASVPSLEVRFADFLDSWKARWRYEPRWPTGTAAFDPRLQRVFDAYRSARPDIVLVYHTCGSVLPFVDELIGHVVDAVDEGPLAKNTIVMVVSDHGFRPCLPCVTSALPASRSKQPTQLSRSFSAARSPTI